MSVLRLAAVSASAVLSLLAATRASAAPAGACAGNPIIDVHLHGYAQDPRFDGRVANPVSGAPLAALDSASHRTLLISTLRKAGVVRGVISNPPLSAQEAAVAQSRGLLRLGYNISHPPTAADLAEIRALHAAGRLTYIGEVSTPYAGIRFDDPRLEPLWALAEELDLPVMLHAGVGPPDAWRQNPHYRIESSDLRAMQDALVRHPKLRVVFQHMGWPMADTTVAMMEMYQQVYLDTGAIDWGVPRPEFHAYLKRLVDAGFGKRILFGSDAMVWTDAVPMAIDAIRSAPFLTEAQKQDILYGNARRFFRWTDLPDC